MEGETGLTRGERIIEESFAWCVRHGEGKREVGPRGKKKGGGGGVKEHIEN